MKQNTDIETAILREFDTLQDSGVLHVGLLLSSQVRTRIAEHLAKTGRLAELNSQRRSRLALIPFYPVGSYDWPGYRVGPLEEISREWRSIMEG